MMPTIELLAGNAFLTKRVKELEAKLMNHTVYRTAALTHLDYKHILADSLFKKLVEDHPIEMSDNGKVAIFEIHVLNKNLAEEGN